MSKRKYMIHYTSRKGIRCKFFTYDPAVASKASRNGADVVMRMPGLRGWFPFIGEGNEHKTVGILSI